MIRKLIEDKEALILISWLFPNLYYTGITHPYLKEKMLKSSIIQNKFVNLSLFG